MIPFPGTGGGPENPAPDFRALAKHLAEQQGDPGAVLAWLSAFAGATDGGFRPIERPRPRLLPRRKTKATYVVRVDLDNARPPIWRRLRLASDLDLARLHAILQLAMGWTDSHLHHFQMGPDAKDYRMAPFLTDFDLAEGETDGIHERDVRLDRTLAKPGQRLFYEYDFGDSWHHTIKLEKVEPWVEGSPDASCTAGRRACPPEDVGGMPGYEEALAALSGDLGDDPEWTRDLLAWLPPDYDPEDFDVDEVNDLLHQRPLDVSLWHPKLADLLARAGSPLSPVVILAGRALAESIELTDAEVDAATLRYRLLLTHVGDGLKLTAAGYLAPSDVRALAEALGPDPDWPFPPSRESDTVPILRLRENAIALGLLRKLHGKLLPTASGRRLLGDPRALFRHIRDRLPLGRQQAQQDAGMLALLISATGVDFHEHREAAGEMLEMIGWQLMGPPGWVAWHESQPTWDIVVDMTTRASLDARSRIATALLAR